MFAETYTTQGVRLIVKGAPCDVAESARARNIALSSYTYMPRWDETVALLDPYGSAPDWKDKLYSWIAETQDVPYPKGTLLTFSWV